MDKVKKEESQPVVKTFAKKRPYLIISAIIFFVAAISLGVYAYLNIQDIKGNIFVGHQTRPTADNSIPTPTPTPVRNDINVLLLGYGGGTHEGTYLTDSMILANINHDTQKISMISIPRDLWVKIPVSENEEIEGKINSAYAIGIDDNKYPNKDPEYTGIAGGGNLTKKIVSQITSLPIDKFAAIDFNGFIQSIDVLGGVDVNIEKSFTDKEYPIEGKEDDTCGIDPTQIPELTKAANFSVVETFPCRFETLTFEKGVTHMDGATALKYVRSRHSLEDGTDFGRSRRQRNLILAVKNKIISIGFIPKILPFVSSLKNDFKTDFTLGEVQNYLTQSDQLSKYSIESFAVTDQNFLENSFTPKGQAILQPIDGEGDWQSLQLWLKTILDQSQPVVKIVNCASQDDLDSVVKYLRDNNYFVLPSIGKCQNKNSKTNVVVFDNAAQRFEINGLKDYFGIDEMLEKPSIDSSFNLQITLGSDLKIDRQ